MAVGWADVLVLLLSEFSMDLETKRGKCVAHHKSRFNQQSESEKAGKGMNSTDMFQNRKRSKDTRVIKALVAPTSKQPQD